MKVFFQCLQAVQGICYDVKLGLEITTKNHALSDFDILM